MWPISAESRLQHWARLRQEAVSTADLERCLLLVNAWWHNTPWQPYYLHWNDWRNWPGPWDLLADNHWCGLARALGIMYTLMMLERSDITDIDIIECNHDNLVQVNKGKYILNWSPDDLLNISSKDIVIKKNISSREFQSKLR